MKKVGASEVRYAFDAVSEHNSYQNICQVLSDKGSKITLVLPAKDYKDIPDYVEKTQTMVGSVHQENAPDSAAGKAGIKIGDKDFGFAWFRLFSRGLKEGWFTPHPYEVIPGGLGGVEEGLSNLKNGLNSATKYVFKIEDTKSQSNL